MSWTQKELEELYQKVNQLASTDADFRKEMQENAHAAIERVAGRNLPEGFRLETIETDLSYNRTFVAPDFAPGELNLRELKSVAGGQGEQQSGGEPTSGDGSDAMVGISFMVIVTVCAAATSVGPCGADVCGAQAGAGETCGGAVCGAEVCAGAACAGEACGGAACAGEACGGAACAGEAGTETACGGAACAGEACGGAACGGDACGTAACLTEVCGGAACGGEACSLEACGGAACGAEACDGAACGGDACGADACVLEACSTAACASYYNPDEDE